MHDHSENNPLEIRLEQKGNSPDMNYDAENLPNNREIRIQPKPNLKDTKLFTRRPPYIKSCSLPNFPVRKLDKIRENTAQESQQCQMYRSSKAPTRILSRDRNVNLNEDLYKKSLSANCESVAGAKEGKEKFEIHPSPKTQARMASEDNCSDESLFPNTILDRHVNCGITKLPALANLQGSIHVPVDEARKTTDGSNYGNDVTNWKQNGLRNASVLFGAFPNTDVRFVSRARNRSQTICDLRSGQIRPRARARTMSSIDDPEYNRLTRVGVASTAETEYSKYRAFGSESEGLNEEEKIAIKGKFRQIGHSVLAVALMKKMASKK